MKEGKSDEALAVANQSRARTLAQGLGVAVSDANLPPAALNPRQIAQKTGATLLFYWLGDKQSYLWAITPAKDYADPASRAGGDYCPPCKLPQGSCWTSKILCKTAMRMDRRSIKLLVAPAAKLIRPQHAGHDSGRWSAERIEL